MNALTKLMDSLLYFGSRDERIRAATDKAGYQGFLVFLVLTAFEVLAHKFGWPGEYSVADLLAALGVTILVVLLQSYRYGVTFLDTQRQRKVARNMMVGTTLAVAVLMALPALRQEGPLFEALKDNPLLLWTLPAIAAVLTAAALWVLIRAMERAVRRRQEKNNPAS